MASHHTGEKMEGSKESGFGASGLGASGKTTKPKDKNLIKAQKYAVNPGPLFNLDDLLAIDLPKSRAEFAEVQAAIKTGVLKPDPTFTSINRTNKLL